MSNPTLTRTLDFEPLEDRLLFSATPVASVDMQPDTDGVQEDGSALINENFTFAVKFQNNGTNTTLDPDPGNSIGYAPFVDVRIAAGIDLNNVNPTYVGQSVDLAGNVANAGDLVGNYAGVAAGYDNSAGTSAVTFTHIYTGQLVTVGAGEEYYVYDLPFGSFVPGQEPVDLQFSAKIDKSELTEFDPLEGLPITAQGGFRFGTDPLNNPGSDPLILGTINTGSILPTVWEVTKDVIAPEDETATGPNFKREWVLTVDIADGERLENVSIWDYLQNNLQYTENEIGAPVAGLTVSYNGTSWGLGNFDTSDLSTSTPGGSFNFTLDYIVGSTAANDIEIRYWTYVPQYDAGGAPVLDPSTGEFSESVNGVHAEADWRPLGTGDPLTVAVEDTVADPHAAPNDIELQDQSLAIQKSVSNGTPAAGDVFPGDDLDYTLHFQVSDYFQFQDLYIVDRLGDGQTFFTNFVSGSSNPGDFDAWANIVLNWHEEGENYAGTFTGTALAVTQIQPNLYQVTYEDYTAYYYDANTGGSPLNFTDPFAGNLEIYGGETLIVFNLSALMEQVAGADGMLIGGYVSSLALGAGVHGGTTGTLTYQTKVNERYVNPARLGGTNTASVDVDDQIHNGVQLYGKVIEWEVGDLNHGDPAHLADNHVWDDSGTTLTVPQPTISKSIYAIEGNPPGVNPSVAPGETVTYNLTLTLPTADIENLEITDFVPLPKFEVGALAFAAVYSDGGNPLFVPATPGANQLVLVLPQEIYDAISGGNPLFDWNAWMATAFSKNPVTNSFSIDLGSFDVDASPANLQIRAYFTLAATDKPMADGLKLTNHTKATYNDTSTNSLVGQDIVQVTIKEPILDLFKGVVGYGSDPLNVVSGVTFNNPGAALGFSISSGNGVNTAEDAANIDNSDLLGGLVDAGDEVRFAMVVENTGRAAAYDLIIEDVIPDGFIPDISQLAIFLGNDGTTPINTALYEVTLVGNTITITFDEAFSLGAGKTADGSLINDGSNYLVILYDLTLAGPGNPPAAISGGTLTNTAQITQYTGTPGSGENRVVTPKEVTADVEVAIPQISKSVVTEIVGTGNDAPTQAVIGESVIYTITLTLAEGDTLNARLWDFMDAGLAFVEFTDFSITANNSIISSTLGNLGSLDAAGLNALIGLGNVNVTYTAAGSGATDFASADWTINFGTLSNFDTDANAETITISYRAVVLNHASNTGTPVAHPNNAARLNYDIEPGETRVISDNAAIDIVEPEVTITKKASRDGVDWVDTVQSAGLDAGDTGYYQIVIGNSAGNPTAYDISFSDNIPPNFIITGWTAVGTTIQGAVNDSNVSSTYFNLTGNTLSLQESLGLDLAAGQSITITVTGIIADTVVPNESLNNTGTVTWTSVDGDEPAYLSDYTTLDTERDYTDNDSASIAIEPIDPVKSIVATSQPDDVTAGTNLVVGEIVRYRLLIALPESTIYDLRFVDALAPGLQFLDDNTATVLFVSNNGINSSLVSDPLLVPALYGTTVVTPTFLLDSLGASAITTSGNTVTFSFGNVTNLDDDAGAEYIIVEFNAIVVNTAASSDDAVTAGGGSDAGDVNPNSFKVQFAETDGGVVSDRATSNTVNVTVFEPNLTLTNQIRNDLNTAEATDGSYDAGDTVTIRMVLSNANAATTSSAYEPVVTNRLDITQFDKDSIVPATVAGYNATVTDDGTYIYVTWTADAETELAKNATQNFTFTVQLTQAVEAGEVLSSLATVSYTSLPDVSPGDWTGSAATSSAVPGLPGSDLGERNGSGGINGDPNDYFRSASDSLTLATPTITKTYDSSNDPNTGSSQGNASNPDLTIGEIVTYTIVVTFREGMTEGVYVYDFGQDNGSAVLEILTATASLSGTTNLSISGVGASMTAVIDSSTGSAFNDRATFYFGNINNEADGLNNADDQITIIVTARVADHVNNQSGDTVSNTARLTYTNGQDVVQNVNTPAVVLDVVAPNLVIDKTVNGVNADTGLLAGDNAEYEIAIRHNAPADSGATSTAPAYDLIFNDPIPQYLVKQVVDNGADIRFTTADIGTGIIIEINGVAIANPLDHFEIDDATYTLRTTAGANIDLLLGQELTITIHGVVSDAVTPDLTVDNTASVAWTSLNDPAANVSTSGERVYAPISDSAQFTTADYVPPVGKAITGTSESSTAATVNAAEGAIGEVITYTLTIDLYDGTVNGLNIRDVLDDGLLFLDDHDVIIAYTGAGTGAVVSTVAAGTYAGTAGFITIDPDGSIWFDLGTVVSAGNASVTITFDVLVRDIGANSAETPTELDNYFEVYHSGDATPAVTSNTVTVTVVEPELGIVKTLTHAGLPVNAGNPVDAGDVIEVTLTVTNSGTSDAWNVVIEDEILAAYFNLGSLTGIEVDGVPIGDLGSGWTAVYDPGTGLLLLTSDAGTSIAAAGGQVEFTFTVTLKDTLAPGIDITNTATVTEYTSLEDGGNPDGRTYDPVSDDATITATSTLDLDKAVINTSVDGVADLVNVTIGEIVTYELNVTLQQGVTQAVTLTDDLPEGFQYVSTTAYFRSADGVSAVGLVSGIIYTNGSLINVADMSVVGGAGGTLTFNFASVTVPATTSVGTADFQVTYNTIVLNVAGNQAESGPGRTNTATVTADLNGDNDAADPGESQSDFETVTLVEPRVEIGKTITSGGPYVAGDTITYEIILTNTGNSTAYNVALSDVIPPGLLGTGVINVTLNGTASTITAPDFTGGGTGLSGVFQIANGVGNSVVITYSAQLQSSVVPGQNFLNQAAATFTSLPDASAAQVRDGSNVPSPTDNSAPGDNDGTPLNNYAVGDSVPESSAAYTPTITKAVIGTSETATGVTSATAVDGAIGEVITYAITADLYQGTLDNFVIADLLPPGMQFLTGYEVTITYSGSTIGGVAAGSYTWGGPLDSASFIFDSLLGSGQSFGDGTDIYFHLGDLTTTDAGATVTITFSALVLNGDGSQPANGDPLVNTAELYYDADGDPDVSNDPTLVETSNTVTVTVVEPDLLAPVKALLSPGSVDAGDTITYSLSITNQGTANAYEVVVTDVLDDDLTFGIVIPASIGVDDAGTVPTVVRDGNVFRISGIEAGQTVTFQFTATVNATVSASELIGNTATLTSYTTLPGDQGTGNATPGDSGDTDGERVYQPDAVSNQVDVTVPGPTIDKINPVQTQYAVGEVVTWQIVVTLPEGVTEQLQITDAIPSGLAFTGYNVINANGLTFATASPTPTSGGTLGSAGANVILNFGNVTVPVSGAANTFVVEISAVVLNIADNQAGVAFDNNATLTYLDPDGELNDIPVGDPGETRTVTDSDPSNDGPLYIIEPELTVNKEINGSASVSGLDGGDAVTYTITITNVAGTYGATAYNIKLSDLIPAAIGNLSYSAELNGSVDVAHYFGLTGQNLTTAGSGFSMNQSDVIVITVTGTVQSANIVPNQWVNNVVDIDWSSLPGDVTGVSTYLDADDPSNAERTGSDGAGSGLNNYADSEDAELTSADYDPSAIKAIISTSETATDHASASAAEGAVGEVITYTITVDLYEGRLDDFIIVDLLPPGMAYVPASANAVYTGDVTGDALNVYLGTHPVHGDLVTDPESSYIYFDLGDLVSQGTTSVTITFQATVLDVATNTAGTELDNTFKIFYDADQDPNTVTPPQELVPSVPINTVTVTVIEPSLTLTKANVSDNPDGVITPGQTVQYTVRVENDAATANGGTAFDVIINDLMPADALSALNIVSVQYFNLADDSAVDPGVEGYSHTVVSAGPDGWTLNLNQLKQGHYILVTYDATFSTDLVANAGQAIDNNARVYWDSLAGGGFDDNRYFEGTGTDSTGDRDYGAARTGPDAVANEVYNVNTLNTQDTERVTVGTGTIGNYVWYDLNADGNQDANEVPLAGITITLTGTNPTLGTTYTLVTTTAADGSYSFTGLAEGTYTITVTLPPGGVITDVTDDGILTPSTSTTVALANGDTNNLVDFGIRGQGAIGDLVWNNLDGDSVRDPGEPGINDVVVNLIWDVNGDGIYTAGVDTIIATTTTQTVGGNFGTYGFDNLLGGAYGNYLVQLDDSNFAPGGVFDNGSVVTYKKDDKLPAPDNRISSVSLAVNEIDLAVDFGVTASMGGLGSVSDTVWFDVNGNGVKEGNEPGIGGVVVYLDQNNNGVRDAFEAFAITDDNGYYIIRGLVNGDYRMRVDASTLPAGAVPTYDLDGIGTANLADFTLLASQNRTDLDFGYRGTATVGDRIWHDADGDGVQDGREKGIAGVEIALYWDANGNGRIDGNEGRQPLLVTTTDGNGNYSFGNLFNSTYVLAINPDTLPSRFRATFDLDGLSTAHTTGASLANGSRFDADFGYYDPRALTGGFRVPSGLFGISFNTLSTYFMTTLDPRFDWLLPDWELVDSTPIFSSPMISGHAEPGSKVVLALYNHRGELVTTSTVLVGSGGNWTVGFAGVEVNGPITIQSSVSSSDFAAFNSDDNFNFRTNYITGLAGGYFQTRMEGIDDTFSSLAYERLDVMMGEDDEIESVEGWKKNDYEFLSAPALPGN